MPHPLAPLHVETVRTRHGLRRFVGLPWHVYDPTRHPQWVPPLRVMVRDGLDEKHNPFYRRASRELFLARRGSRLVGRIAAIENRAHNEFHGDRVGFYGFFECADDQEAAGALFDAAGTWLRARGLDTMRGPASPSFNHECGLLVRGFRHHPMFLTPWNPRYYVHLHEGAGMRPVKNLLGYFIPVGWERYQLPERFRRQAERATRRQGLSFRTIDLDHYWDDAAVMWNVYNAAWERNWGFVPMTWEEFRAQARDLRRLIIPEFVFVAELDGRPAGFCVILPDYNQILKRIPDGRLFPTGFFKILAGKRRLRTGRIFALGVRAEYRNRGLMALIAYEAYRRGRAYGAMGVEASWVLEDNEAMISPIQAAGAKVYRRWRIYERSLTG